MVGAAPGGYATDRRGRKRVFIRTILIYLFGVLGTGSSRTAAPPSRASRCASPGLASAASTPGSTPPSTSCCLRASAALAIGVLMLRAFVPESPRWLMVHDQPEKADEVVSDIERQIEEETGESLSEPPDEEAIDVPARARRAHRTRQADGRHLPAAIHARGDADDPGQMRQFQREHDLEATGVVDKDPVEQLRAVRRDSLGVDPSDPESVKTFQRKHGLQPTGVIDEETGVALRAVQIERERQAQDEGGGAERLTGEGEEARPYSQRGLWAGFTYVASTPRIDRDLDTELDGIEEIVDERGPLSRSQVHDQVGADQWGPGRFHRAFNVAVEEGRIEWDDGGRWTAARKREPLA